MADERYLTAKEAAAALGISVQTLYAYVSRGLVRSELVGDKTRAKRYLRADIEKLKRRQTLRRNPDQAVTGALRYGLPVLESAITLIEGGRFYYRGHDVLTLAQERRFECVANLIWRGDLGDEVLIPSLTSVDLALYNSVAPQLTYLFPMAAFQTVLPLVAANDLRAYDLSETAVCRTGSRILRWLTVIATQNNSAGGIATALQEGWQVHSPDAVRLIKAALVLCADHELNISAFTARCVASAGADPYAVVTAGLAALQGRHHGGYTERVAALWREIKAPAQVPSVLMAYLRRGEKIPGFGHPLYPDGDPRGRLLLALLRECDVLEAAVAIADTICEVLAESHQLYPTLDFGLVALARALQLPAGAPLALFAIGRTVGWLGHAIEQYQKDQMIRPRAQYVGVLPK